MAASTSAMARLPQNSPLPGWAAMAPGITISTALSTTSFTVIDTVSAASASSFGDYAGLGG